MQRREQPAGRWDVNVHFNKARRTRQASCSGEEAVNGRGWDMLRGPEGKRTAAGRRAASNSVTSGESPPLEPPLSPSEERGDEVRHRLWQPRTRRSAHLPSSPSRPSCRSCSPVHLGKRGLHPPCPQGATHSRCDASHMTREINPHPAAWEQINPQN